jgi:hypothetical protein
METARFSLCHHYETTTNRPSSNLNQGSESIEIIKEIRLPPPPAKPKFWGRSVDVMTAIYSEKFPAVPLHEPSKLAA